MVRRNYKIHANIGFTRRFTQRYAVVLDTGAASSFIRKDVIPQRMWNKINTSRNLNFRDARKRKVHTSGTIDLAVEVGDRVEVVNFNVVERIAINVLLDCDYCDQQFEEIKPRQRVVQFDDSTTVLIIRNPGARNRNGVPLPEAQKFPKGNKRTSTKVKVSKPVTLQPESQPVITVTTDQRGLIVVEPVWRIFDSNMCLVGTGVTQLTPNTELRVLFAYLGKNPKTLTEGQTIATAVEHPTAMMGAPITHGEVLGVAVEKLYRKSLCHAKSENVINRALSNNREQVFGEAEEKPITAETVPLGLESKYHPEIRKVLNKHESMWLGQLGEIKVTTLSIDLIPGKRQLCLLLTVRGQRPEN